MSDAPYEPRGQVFELPGGGVGMMTDVVSPTDRGRYLAEVKLLQLAIGVSPDGIIGQDTRRAARRAYDQRVGNPPAPNQEKR